MTRRRIKVNESSPRLLEEIVERDPDIVALEEVDDFAFFQSNLSRLGYAGFHVPKPSSPCLKTKDNIGPDGTAVFVRRDRFDIIGRGSEILTKEDRRTRSYNSILSMLSVCMPPLRKCHFLALLH